MHPRSFRKPHDDEIELSTVGVGSYLGLPDDQTDFQVYSAVKHLVLHSGINVLDTAPNYRCLKAERAIGAALRVLTQKYGVQRD